MVLPGSQQNRFTRVARVVTGSPLGTGKGTPFVVNSVVSIMRRFASVKVFWPVTQGVTEIICAKQLEEPYRWRPSLGVGGGHC